MIRLMSTVVLPLPAPASSSSGPSVQNTASRCLSLRAAKSSSMMDWRSALYFISNSVIAMPFFLQIFQPLPQDHILGRQDVGQIGQQHAVGADPQVLPRHVPLACHTVKNDHRDVARVAAQRRLGLFQPVGGLPGQPQVELGPLWLGRRCRRWRRAAGPRPPGAAPAWSVGAVIPLAPVMSSNVT